MYNSKNQHPASRSISGLLEDLFQNGISHFRDLDLRQDAPSGQIPVNIRETENSFQIHVVAPGIPKEEFKVNVDKNVLSISYEHQEETKEETAKWLRSEYRINTFKRNFTLNEKIDPGGIHAAYNDGILTVTLPKKEITTQAVQSIQVQ